MKFVWVKTAWQGNEKNFPLPSMGGGLNQRLPSVVLRYFVVKIPHLLVARMEARSAAIRGFHLVLDSAALNPGYLLMKVISGTAH